MPPKRKIVYEDFTDYKTYGRDVEDISEETLNKMTKKTLIKIIKNLQENKKPVEERKFVEERKRPSLPKLPPPPARRPQLPPRPNKRKVPTADIIPLDIFNLPPEEKKEPQMVKFGDIPEELKDLDFENGGIVINKVDQFQSEKKVKNVFQLRSRNKKQKSENKEYIVVYNLNTPEDLDEKGIGLIEDELDRAIGDIQMAYGDFKPLKFTIGIKCRVVKDGKDTDFVTLSIRELAYPDYDYTLLESYIESEKQRFAKSDAYLEVIDIKVYFIPDPSGSCYKDCKFKHDFKTSYIGNVKIYNPVSNHNNCFFACLKDKFKEREIFKLCNQKACNIIREKYGLKKDCSITVTDGKKIARELLGIEIGIANESLEYFGESGEVDLMLIGDHYVRIEGIKQRCAHCGVTYLNKHDESSCAQRHTYNLVHETKDRFVIPNKLRSKYWDGKNEMDYVLHYDIETYKKNEYGHSEPNCVGFAWRDKNTKEIKYETINGEGCMDRFVQRYREEDMKHIKFINAFNGANFDAYYLMRSEGKLYDDLSYLEILKTAGGIITAQVNKNEYKKEEKKGDREKVLLSSGIKIIDISKHLQGNLKKNLDYFKCNVQKGEFDHTRNKNWEELDEKTRGELLKYLESDVKGLMELTEKLHGSYMELYGTSPVHWISTSQLTYALWVNNCVVKNKNSVRLPNLEEWDFIQKSLIGGRCQVHKKFFMSKEYQAMVESGKVGLEKINETRYKTNISAEEYEKIEDYMVDLDIVSLYPTAMTMEYPIGVPEWTLDYVDGKMGIYQVEFKANKKCLFPPFPIKQVKGKIEWNVEDGEGFYTSVDIENARMCGYEFKVIRGLVWPEKTKLMEEYIKDSFKMKENSEKGTPAYLLSKLMMNGLYGKFLQKSRFDKVLFVSEKSDWNKIIPNYYVEEIDDYSFKNQAVIYCSLKDPSKREKNIKKPNYLGAFVLAYSRKIMIECYKKLNPNNEIEKDIHYTDTDSLQVHNKIFKESGIVCGKKLGDLSNDLGDTAKIINAIYVAPKMYILKYLKREKDGSITLNEHRVGKGVKKVNNSIPLDSDTYMKMMNGETYEIENKDVFTRFAYKMNSKEKEKGTDYFSIAIRECKKILNKTPWAGRYFIEGDSVPIGYEF